MKISMKQWQQHHQQKQQQKPEQKRNGWPDAKIERTGARRDLSSRFVTNDWISDKRYGGEKAWTLVEVVNNCTATVLQQGVHCPGIAYT